MKHCIFCLCSNLISLKNICLFRVLHHFQHFTGHMTTGSWKGNQYIQLVTVDHGFEPEWLSLITTSDIGSVGLNCN